MPRQTHMDFEFYSQEIEFEKDYLKQIHAQEWLLTSGVGKTDEEPKHMGARARAAL